MLEFKVITNTKQLNVTNLQQFEDYLNSELGKRISPVRVVTFLFPWSNVIGVVSLVKLDLKDGTGIAPAEIYNITTDFLVFEGEYEAGKTHGYITFMSYENVDAVTNYFKKLAKEEYKVELTEDVYGISFVLYNDNVPITISISVADLEEYGYFVSYEAMEMTYEQASKI
jgi:hypothetical protein